MMCETDDAEVLAAIAGAAMRSAGDGLSGDALSGVAPFLQSALQFSAAGFPQEPASEAVPTVVHGMKFPPKLGEGEICFCRIEKHGGRHPVVVAILSIARHRLDMVDGRVQLPKSEMALIRLPV